MNSKHFLEAKPLAKMQYQKMGRVPSCYGIRASSGHGVSSLLVHLDLTKGYIEHACDWPRPHLVR